MKPFLVEVKGIFLLCRYKCLVSRKPFIFSFKYFKILSQKKDKSIEPEAEGQGRCVLSSHEIKFKNMHQDGCFTFSIHHVASLNMLFIS